MSGQRMANQPSRRSGAMKIRLTSKFINNLCHTPIPSLDFVLNFNVSVLTHLVQY